MNSLPLRLWSVTLSPCFIYSLNIQSISHNRFPLSVIPCWCGRMESLDSFGKCLMFHLHTVDWCECRGGNPFGALGQWATTGLLHPYNLKEICPLGLHHYWWTLGVSLSIWDIDFVVVATQITAAKWLYTFLITVFHSSNTISLKLCILWSLNSEVLHIKCLEPLF